MLKLIDGTEREVKIYAVRLSEKNQLSRKFRKKVLIGTGNNKTMDIDVHDDEIIKGIMDIALQGQVVYDDLDFGEDEIYQKYFNPKKIVDKVKNSNTSES